MECFYINVDAAAERRRHLEDNFRQHKAPGWFLSRVRAVDVHDLATVNIPGTLRPAEKGCHMSHRNAIAESFDAPGHALILEDDVVFGPRSCAALDRAVASLPENGWDILFADAMIGDPALMMRLLLLRRELEPQGGQILLPLRDWPHAGATAYVVNARYKQRLHELVNISPLDAAYDLLLRWHVMNSGTRAFLIVPFPIALSTQGDRSQVQSAQGIETDIIWTSFRRLIALDRDIGAARELIARLPDDFMDEESAIFARIVGSALSRKLAVK